MAKIFNNENVSSKMNVDVEEVFKAQTNNDCNCENVNNKNIKFILWVLMQTRR